jgi:arylsulfatase A-like enzyme
LAEVTRSEPEPAGSLRAALWGDLGRVTVLALCGCAAFAVWEYGASLYGYPLETTWGMRLRFAALAVTLAAVLWVMAVPALFALAAGARVTAWLRDRDGGVRWVGLFVLGTLPGERPLPARPAGAWLWGLAAGAVVYVNVSALATLYFVQHFKEPQLTALVLAVLQLPMIAAGLAITLGVAALVASGARRLHPHLGGWNPLGRAVPALALMVALGTVGIKVLIGLMPQLGPLVPWASILAGFAFAGGLYGGAVLLRARGRLLPAARRQRRITLAVGVPAILLLVSLTLTRFGAEPRTRYIAISSSPPLSWLIDVVRWANDFDGDGFGSLLGENDCAPFDASIYPGAPDIPDDGIDQNCDGRDFSLAQSASYRTGERMPVPEPYRRDWNILLITVDTVRYDHTSFGGYPEKAGRDTTPNLAELVARSTSFTFANAPSAGTMASIPAILTSKFFHSGIALDEKVKPGMPPRLTPENTLISEILKRSGYATGAILTHEYFEDWGMEQGFDSYDNELGKKPDPFKVTSPQVTDRALAWISRHADKKWFLWAHYLDPHGRYVAHPGEKSFGSTEKDLYDGELHFTDKHLGRLFAELERMPGAERTIIIITSDHGDGFGEHGFINHGMALYRELVHVPLIFYIPNLPPREVPGATSPIDIVPTVADLAGIDVSDLSFEGESLVPQLFHGRDANHRVVFAETNWPKPLRAAITSEYKLVYDLRNNIYELYDLEKDPWEKRNLAHTDKEGLATMKGYLDDWLERVYFARDRETNQAAAKLDDVLLGQPPSPKVPVHGVTFDEGRIEVLGYDVKNEPFKAGDTVPLALYFRVKDRPSGPFRLQVEVWPEDPETRPDAARSQLRFTAKGMFPTHRWRPGEFVRDRFGPKLPAGWREAGTLVVGLRMTDDQREPVVPTGETKPGDPNLAILGRIRLEASEPQAPGRPPMPSRRLQPDP